MLYYRFKFIFLGLCMCKKCMMMILQHCNESKMMYQACPGIILALVGFCLELHCFLPFERVYDLAPSAGNNWKWRILI